MSNPQQHKATLAFIGSAGIPNRYGGFEAFLEHCTPEMVRQNVQVIVTCDANLYADQDADFKGVERKFLRIRANGASSVLHDLLAFFAVFRQSSHIVVLGVSGGLWFPFWRLACAVAGKRLLVNIDGVEWRRSKFSPRRQKILKLFDWLAQACAHRVIYDNGGLREFVLSSARTSAVEIAYPGDYIQRRTQVAQQPGTALTICRIEPENNIDLLIDGFLASPLNRFTIVGNWQNSAYGMALKAKHQHERRLTLLDPIYDPAILADLREQCSVYLHGHSVGGTNPSLVEMLFYDCEILCFDCIFHRCTAAESARYFDSRETLCKLLAEPARDATAVNHARQLSRAKYTRQVIAKKYIDAALSGT